MLSCGIDSTISRMEQEYLDYRSVKTSEKECGWCRSGRDVMLEREVGCGGCEGYECPDEAHSDRSFLNSGNISSI
jgi:hypothetical protein